MIPALVVVILITLGALVDAATRGRRGAPPVGRRATAAAVIMLSAAIGGTTIGLGPAFVAAFQTVRTTQNEETVADLISALASADGDETALPIIPRLLTQLESEWPSAGDRAQLMERIAQRASRGSLSIISEPWAALAISVWERGWLQGHPRAVEIASMVARLTWTIMPAASGGLLHFKPEVDRFEYGDERWVRIESILEDAEITGASLREKSGQTIRTYRELDPSTVYLTSESSCRLPTSLGPGDYVVGLLVHTKLTLATAKMQTIEWHKQQSVPLTIEADPGFWFTPIDDEATRAELLASIVFRSDGDSESPPGLLAMRTHNGGWVLRGTIVIMPISVAIRSILYVDVGETQYEAETVYVSAYERGTDHRGLRIPLNAQPDVTANIVLAPLREPSRSDHDESPLRLWRGTLTWTDVPVRITDEVEDFQIMNWRPEAADRR